MKKLFLLAIILFSSCIYAQENKRYVYAEIIAIERLLEPKVSVSINYGQEISYWTYDKIQNEKGKTKSFNSVIDAVNYMAYYGWELHQTYVVKLSEDRHQTRRIMKKAYSSDEDYQTDIISTFRNQNK